MAFSAGQMDVARCCERSRPPCHQGDTRKDGRRIMPDLIGAIEDSIKQLEIEIAKADLMAARSEDGEIKAAATERAQRLRQDLEYSRENLRAAQVGGE